MKNLPTYFKEHGIGECAPEKNIADFALERVKAVDSSYTQKMESGKQKTEQEEEKKTDGTQSQVSPSPSSASGSTGNADKAQGPQQATGGDITKDLAEEFKHSREG